MTLLQILYSTPYRDLVSLSKGSKIHLEMLLYLVIIDLSYTFFVDICSLLIKLRKHIWTIFIVENLRFGSAFGFDPKLKCSQKYWKAVQLLALIPMRDLHLSHFSLEITTGGAFDKGQMATHGFKGSWRWPNWHHHSSRTPCFSLGMEQRHFCLRSNAANLWARLIEKDPAKQLIPNIWGPRSLFLKFPTFMSVVGIGYSTTTAPCCSDALVAPFNAPFSVGK